MEEKLHVLFHCPNPRCPTEGKPQDHFVTRTELREMSRPDSEDKWMCNPCGGMYTLTKDEKSNNLNMLDKEARAS